VLVYSHTACRRPQVAARCLKAGAQGVINSTSALASALVESSKRVLCLASLETTGVVQQVAGQHGYLVEAVRTVADAVAQLRSGTWGVVVAALGTNADADTLLFDSSGGSELISRVIALRPRPLMVVFSHTACSKPEFAQTCADSGADKVLCSAEALDELVCDLEAASMLRSSVSSVEPGSVCETEELAKWEIYGDVESYPLVAQRRAREAELASVVGKKHSSYKRYKQFTDEIAGMLSALPSPLAACTGQFVRVVHVSDSHHHHDSIDLPPGDVLIHTGDLVGNYGNRDIATHLAHFLEWLKDVSQLYQFVVFIAGNHDVLLDPKIQKHRQVRDDFLGGLPDNVKYLEHSGVSVCGLHIWGSPTCVCRHETLGKRYYSNAFETPCQERQQVWSSVPEGLDLLMTHNPPKGTLCHSAVGDKLLADRLAAMATPPRFHCFGHDHDFFGVACTSTTVCLNGAQEGVRRLDPSDRTCAWVFDVPLSS